MNEFPEKGRMKDKYILVAGGTGLVGANLTGRLVSLGANVRATYFTKKPAFREDLYSRCDFTGFEDCLAATENMNYVIICTAQTFGPKMMKEHPTAQILPNLKIYAGLLEACRLNKVEKVVFISSSTVYQETDHPVKEHELDLNKPPYALYFGIGWVNRYIEQLAAFYWKTYGMAVGIVRPPGIYGPHDKFDEEKSNVLPALIKRALKREVPFTVWGDGNAVRDFLYVEDLADDLPDIMENYCVCDPINVGSGRGIAIKDVVRIVLDACGHKTAPVYDETKPSGIPYRVLDLSKFESIFGKRKRTSIEEGIRRTVEWYKEELRVRS